MPTTPVALSSRHLPNLAALVSASAIALLLMASPPASAQGLFGLASPDVSLAAEQSPLEEVVTVLEEREADFESRLDTFQSRFGWRLERLAEQRQSLQQTITSLTQRRDDLDPVAEAERRQIQGEIIVRTRELARRVGQVEEAYDNHLSTLTDGASLARQLRIQIESISADPTLSVAQVEARLTGVARQLDELETRRSELRADRDELEAQLDEHQDALEDARTELHDLELAESRRQVASDSALQRANSAARAVRERARSMAQAWSRALAEARRQWMRGASRRLLRQTGAAGWSAALVPDPTPWVALVAAPFALTLESLPDSREPAPAQAMARAEVVVDQARESAESERAGDGVTVSSLETRLLQLEVQLLDRRRELDRQRIEIVNIELEKLATRRPALEYRAGFLREELREAVAREEGTIWDREAGHFDAPHLDALTSHAGALLADPGRALSAATTQLSLRRGPAPGAAALVVLGLLVAAAWPLWIAIRRLANRVGGPGQRPPYYKTLRLLAWALPLSLLLAGAVLLDVLPPGLHGIAWLLALAPPAWIGVGLLARLLYPVGGTERFPARGARTLRVVIWTTAVLVTALTALTTAMPALGFPGEAELPVEGLALLIALLGASIALARRRVIMARFRMGEDRKGPLVATLRRLYPIVVGAPLVLGVVYLAGYHDLAQVILRRGVVVVAVLSVVPWGHGRLQSVARSALGYPDGGGPFATTASSAQTGYRVVAPVISVLVGAIGLLVIASSWGLKGSVVGNIEAALTATLLSFGETRITVLDVVLVVAAIVGTVAVTRWLLPMLRHRVYPIYDLTEGMRAAFDTVVKYALFVVGLLVTLQVIGLGVGFLALFAGVIGLAVGFGSQTLAANFMSGLILQFSKPVNVGDHIEVEGVVGRIQRISSYATVVRTFENVSVIVPNSVLIGEKVVNWTEGHKHRRFNVDVGVAYGSDVQLVTQLLLEAAERHDMVLATPQPSVKFQEFGDSSLNFSLQVWIDQPDKVYGIASSLRYAIDDVFRQHDIEIPFPQRDLHLRSAESVISIAQAKGWDAHRPTDGSPAQPI